MKKYSALLVLLSICSATLLFSAADYKKIIIGTWDFNMGAGMEAQIEYKADGTFIQRVGDMLIKGTFSIAGDTLTTKSGGKTTTFTLSSSTADTLTVKRKSDGRTMLYKRKKQ